MFIIFTSDRLRFVQYSKNTLFSMFIAFIVCQRSSSQYCGSKESCPDENRGLTDNENLSKYHTLIKYATKSYVPYDNFDCSCFHNVIIDDLQPFQTGITVEQFRKAKRFGIHYQILNRTLFRQKTCNFEPRCKGIEYFLKKISFAIPNTEFIINVRDWPEISKYSYRSEPLPLFSFSKTNHEYFDILYPAWSFWQGGPAISLYPTGIGRWDLLKESIRNKSEGILWTKKISKVFFRGSRTDVERDALILLSRNYSNLYDAKYTKNQAWKSEKDTLGEEAAVEVSFEDHCRYKYLANFRGVAASFRFRHLFLCKSLVLHFGEEWKEFFYSALKPWIHYVPVMQDSSNLQEILAFLIDNDELAFKIASEGFEFILKHLTLETIECYWRRLLRRYSRLLKYNVVLEQDMIKIL